MGVYLQKAVAVGPGQRLYHQIEKSSDTHIDNFTDTNTGLVRIWATWPRIEPNCEASLSSPEPVPRNQYWKELDDSIRTAKSKGLYVMLCAYQYAPWDVTWREKDKNDKQYQQSIPDRVPSSLKDKIRLGESGWYGRLQTETNGFAGGLYKPIEFKIPDRLGPDSNWGRFIAKLLSRYTRTSALNPDPQNMYIDFFQPVNEPNYQLWPQQSPSSNPSNPWERSLISIHCSVLQMLQTTQHIREGINRATPILVGPDTADNLIQSNNPNALAGRYRTPCLDIPKGRNNGFTELLLGIMKAVQFDSTAFAWSHHNHNDIEEETFERLSNNPNNDPPNVHRAARVREVLQEKGWTGFAYNVQPVGPKLFLTEGGCRLGAVNDDLVEQSRRLQAGYDRIKNSPLGEGVEMFTQYLFNTDASYDSGLCEADPFANVRRPAYTMWKGLPRT